MNNNYYEMAKAKLEKEHEDGKSKYGRYEKVMAEETLKALLTFAEQDREFAQAICENSQTFADCMANVAKGISNSISDFKAYEKAVQFYFPNAKIEFQMKIFVNPFDLEEKQSDEYMSFSLSDLLN